MIAEKTERSERRVYGAKLWPCQTFIKEMCRITTFNWFLRVKTSLLFCQVSKMFCMLIPKQVPVWLDSVSVFYFYEFSSQQLHRSNIFQIEFLKIFLPINQRIILLYYILLSSLIVFT